MKNYDEWEEAVSESIKGDLLWKMQVYRLSLFVGDIGWYDVTKLNGDRRTIKVSDQLYRALGSISANIAEGFNRSSRKDQVRFWEYTLGSARESRDWYFKSRHVLNDDVCEHRMQLITKIIRLLLTMIPKNRDYIIGEEQEKYQISQTSNQDCFQQEIPY